MNIYYILIRIRIRIKIKINSNKIKVNPQIHVYTIILYSILHSLTYTKWHSCVTYTYIMINATLEFKHKLILYPQKKNRERERGREVSSYHERGETRIDGKKEIVKQRESLRIINGDLWFKNSYHTHWYHRAREILPSWAHRFWWIKFLHFFFFFFLFFFLFLLNENM